MHNRNGVHKKNKNRIIDVDINNCKHCVAFGYSLPFALDWTQTDTLHFPLPVLPGQFNCERKSAIGADEEASALS